MRLWITKSTSYIVGTGTAAREDDYCSEIEQ